MARRTACTIVLFLACVACTGTPRGVEAVPDFDVDRDLGLGYEIARLDHPFERGLVDVTARYSVREDGGIRVIALDREHYAWALVAGPSRSYLWILAREPDPAPDVVQELIDRAAALEFPVEGLIRVEHGVAPEPAS